MQDKVVTARAHSKRNVPHHTSDVVARSARLPLEDDPLEPREVTIDQARHFAESLARGEPNRTKIALTVLNDKVRELL